MAKDFIPIRQCQPPLPDGQNDRQTDITFLATSLDDGKKRRYHNQKTKTGILFDTSNYFFHKLKLTRAKRNNFPLSVTILFQRLQEIGPGKRVCGFQQNCIQSSWICLFCEEFFTKAFTNDDLSTSEAMFTNTSFCCYKTGARFHVAESLAQWSFS